MYYVRFANIYMRFPHTSASCWPYDVQYIWPEHICDTNTYKYFYNTVVGLTNTSTIHLRCTVHWPEVLSAGYLQTVLCDLLKPKHRETHLALSETCPKHFWNILKLSEQFPKHFWNISETFWNISEAFLKHFETVWHMSDVLWNFLKHFRNTSQTFWCNSEAFLKHSETLWSYSETCYSEIPKPSEARLSFPKHSETCYLH